MLHILILMVVYLFPAAILFHFAADTFFRNPARSEFQLVSLALFSAMLMFVEEFTRQILPVSYSEPLVLYAFGNLGALSAMFVTRFYFDMAVTSLRVRPRVYIPLSYMILVPSLVRSAWHRHVDFYRIGNWIQPVYNTRYYIAAVVGILLAAGLSAVMFAARKKAVTSSAKKRFGTMFWASILITGWHLVFGILPGVFPVFRDLPPYPYLFGDLGWMIMLRWAMSTQELLPHYGKQYKTLFNLVPAAIVVADTDARILEANPTAKQLFGEHPVRLTDLLSRPRREHTTLINLFRNQSIIENYETELLQENGTVMSALVSVDFVEVDGHPLSISVIRDITDHKIAEQRIAHLAYYDSLTDLPNRASFYQCIDAAIAKAGADPEPFAVLLVDIDYFKQINDSFGHQAGDLAIQHVASSLRSILQPGDIAARLGGDEFVLMVQHFAGRDELLQMAERLVHQLNSRAATDVQTILLSASVGVAVYPDHGSTPDELVKSADLAMYEAKQTGRNRCVMAPAQPSWNHNPTK